MKSVLSIRSWKPFGWWALLLLAVMAGGAVGGVLVFTRGLGITNLSDLVPWGLWIAIDLSSIALSAGAFLLSAAVYLLGLKRFQPVARTAVFIGLIGYSMALMTLLLDIGRPDRFWHALAFWNPHSPLWEVTMCVALYFSVLLLESAPIFARFGWLQQRWPGLVQRLEHVHKLAPVLAVAGLCLSMLHQSSLGATYGILKARPIWYQPGLPVLFIVSAAVAGPALTVLASMLAARLSPRTAKVDDGLLSQLSRFVGWTLLLYLYLRFWDVLAMSYTYEPGRTEGLQLLTRGSLAYNFWVGEILVGAVVPAFILLNRRLRAKPWLRMLALLGVVGGLVAYRWDINMVGQLVVFAHLPQGITPQYTHYTPALVEWITGLGVVAYGLLAFSLGARYLRVVDHTPEVEAAPERQPALALAGGD